MGIRVEIGVDAGNREAVKADDIQQAAAKSSRKDKFFGLSRRRNADVVRKWNDMSVCVPPQLVGQQRLCRGISLIADTDVCRTVTSLVEMKRGYSVHADRKPIDP